MKNAWVTLLLLLPLRASPISDTSTTVYLGAGDSLAFEIQTSSFTFNAARYGLDPYVSNISFALITAPLSHPFLRGSTPFLWDRYAFPPGRIPAPNTPAPFPSFKASFL